MARILHRWHCILLVSHQEAPDVRLNQCLLTPLCIQITRGACFAIQILGLHICCLNFIGLRSACMNYSEASHGFCREAGVETHRSTVFQPLLFMILHCASICCKASLPNRTRAVLPSPPASSSPKGPPQPNLLPSPVGSWEDDYSSPFALHHRLGG